VCKPIDIGGNNDPYQSIETKRRLTRATLALLNKCNHPCMIVTKNAIAPKMHIFGSSMDGSWHQCSRHAQFASSCCQPW